MHTFILVNSLKEDEAGLAEEEMDETVEEGLTVTEVGRPKVEEEGSHK